MGQYLQLSTGRRLLISLTLFCTNCFHSLSMPLIQQSATSESLQRVIFLIGTSYYRAPSTAVTNLASMTAAKSSNLGIFGYSVGLLLSWMRQTSHRYERLYELEGRQLRHMPLRNYHKIREDYSRQYHCVVP